MDDKLRKFVLISVNRMAGHYAPKLIYALETLKSEELWLHEYEHMNTIGGIALHICEHVNRHTIRYAITGSYGYEYGYQPAGSAYENEEASGVGEIKLAASGGGIEDYFPEGMHTAVELAEQVKKTFRLWQKVMLAHVEVDSPDDRLDISDIYHLVEHTSYHLGQIVDRSQRISQRSFQFMQNGLSEQALKEILDKSG